MDFSPSQQRNAVSQGVALGLLMCGRDELHDHKTDVDMSFENAWISWAYRRQFPQVNTDIRNGSDGVVVMTHADAQKHAFHLFWDTSGTTITVQRRERWQDSELDPDLIASKIGGNVPAAGWQALAKDFLDQLDA